MIDNIKQKNVGKFVGREVLACQSMLVEEMLKTGALSCNYDDIENYYKPYCHECGGEMIKIDDTFKCESCGITDDSPDDKPTGIFEWWIVSDWLLKKLEAEGEPILRTDFGEWWGRTCTGQAILLDDIINKIYDDLPK